jgi:hypothetical protein
MSARRHGGVTAVAHHAEPGLSVCLKLAQSGGLGEREHSNLKTGASHDLGPYRQTQCGSLRCTIKDSGSAWLVREFLNDAIEPALKRCRETLHRLGKARE